MSLTFASLSEAWGDQVSPPAPSNKRSKKHRKDPLCSLYQQSQNINKEHDDDFLTFLDEDEMLSNQTKDCKAKTSRYDVRPSREPAYKYIDEYEQVELKDNIPNHMKRNQIKSSLSCAPSKVPDTSSKEINGYNVHDTDDYFEYANMSKDDLSNICGRKHVFVEEEEDFDEHYQRAPSKNKNITVHEEYDSTTPTPNKLNRGTYRESFQDDEVPVSNNKQPYDTKQSMMDFLLYIFSGILLIMMMEQILLLGMKMKA